MTRLPAFAVILSLVIGLVPGASFANSFTQRLYGDVHLGAARVEHSDLDFLGSFTSLSAGVWLFRGIGIEAYIDQGLSSGREGSFELELTKATGAAIRFQSPPTDGFFGYVLLGISDIRIEQDENNNAGQRTVVQNFNGGRLSVGIGQQLGQHDWLMLVGEYRNYFVDSDLQIDGLSLGLRFNLQ